MPIHLRRGYVTIAVLLCPFLAILQAHETRWRAETDTVGAREAGPAGSFSPEPEQGDAFAIRGLRCSASPGENSAGGRLSCSASAVNVRAGLTVTWEWRLSIGKPGGSQRHVESPRGMDSKWEADGVTPGPHTIVATARDGSWGVATETANVVVPAGPSFALPGEDGKFAMSGVSCTVDPTHSAGVFVSCSAAVLNAREGRDVKWEWRLAAGRVTGTRQQSDSIPGGTSSLWSASGVAPGRTTIVVYARDGSGGVVHGTANVDVPARSSSPASQPTQPQRPPQAPQAASPSAPDLITIMMNAGTASVPARVSVPVHLTPQEQAIVRARCNKLFYTVMTMAVASDRASRIPDLYYMVYLACKWAGVPIVELPVPNFSAERAVRAVQGKASLDLRSGALRLTGAQAGVDLEVKTPAGTITAPGLADLTAAYSPEDRRIRLTAHSGPATFTPATAGVGPFTLQPGRSLQWDAGTNSVTFGSAQTPYAPPPSPQPQSPPPVVGRGFAGSWKTTWGDWGIITLQVAGNRVWGYYGGDGTPATAGGTLEGTFEGRVARFRWKDRNNGQLWGGAMFSLSDDGNTLTGHRNDWKEPDVAMYKWNAQRSSRPAWAVTQPQSPASVLGRGFAGSWKTTWGDWGQITLQVAGNRVWGYYGGDGTQATAGGTLEGTSQDGIARFRWTDRNGQHWGGAMFTLSSDGNTLTGHRNDWKEPDVAMYKWNAERMR